VARGLGPLPFHPLDKIIHQRRDVLVARHARRLYVSNVGKRLTRDTTSWKTFSTAVLFARSELHRTLRYGQIFDAIYGSHLMPSWSIDDLRHWRDRAEEARLVAADMKDPDFKEAMLRIAKHYERLADRAQRLGKGLAQS